MSGIGLRNMMNDRNNVPAANYRDSRLRMHGKGSEGNIREIFYREGERVLSRKSLLH